MPEFYRLLLIFVCLPTLALWISYLIVGPTIRAVRNTRIQVSTPLKPMLPTDPRLPGGARWFFADVWAQLESIGFEPVIYLHSDAIASGGASFLMILEHPVNQDGVAAAIAFVPGRHGASVQCSVEYSTESPERLDVTTTNSSGADILPRLPNERVLRVPGMRDLAALYSVHGLHLATTEVREKRNFPAPTQLHADMQNATFRRFTWLADMGAVRFTDEGRRVRFNWRCALGVAWKLLPINRRSRLTLARRRAARWLNRHGMPGHYEYLDFARAVANHGAFSGNLPIPDWYPSADDTVGRWFKSCDVCRSRVAADRPDCDVVTCSTCGLEQTPTDESPLIAFDLAPKQSERCGIRRGVF